MAHTVNFIILVVEIRSVGLTEVGGEIQGVAHSVFQDEIQSVKIHIFWKF